MSAILAFVRLLFASQFLRLADTGDDVLHVVDGDGFSAVGFQFVKQFCDAGLDVVDDLLAARLVSERLSERLDILL